MRRVGAGAARLHLTGLDDIRALLTPLGDAWLVGGCLRDAALGAPLTDVDVAVAGDAAEPARRLARDTGATRFRLSGAFGSWRLHGGRLPVDVDVTPLQGPLHEDLGRRDFAINAMAMAIAGDGALIDPHGGMADAAARRLRAVSDHALADDPVRVLRAARLSQQHGLTEAQVAERIGRHIVRLRRSKAATSHPTPDGIRKLSAALDVTAERLSRFWVAALSPRRVGLM